MHLHVLYATVVEAKQSGKGRQCDGAQREDMKRDSRQSVASNAPSDIRFCYSSGQDKYAGSNNTPADAPRAPSVRR